MAGVIPGIVLGLMLMAAIYVWARVVGLPRQPRASAREILVPSLDRGPDGKPRFVGLGEVADIRIVEGPSTIKSEDGMLRNYVRLNVRGRGVVESNA